MKTYSLASWLLLLLALIAWGAIVYAHLTIQSEAEERGFSAQTAEQKTTKAAYQSRLRVLATETAAERERLDIAARSDIVSIANTIEAAGKGVGVQARVSAAIPVGTPIEISDDAALQKIAFIVQAEGTFSGVVQLVRALESFPGFSTVEQFEFERVQSQERGVPPWRTSIRLQITTSSDIAS